MDDLIVCDELEGGGTQGQMNMEERLPSIWANEGLNQGKWARKC